MTKLHFADLVRRGRSPGTAAEAGTADATQTQRPQPTPLRANPPRPKLTSEAAWRLRLEGLSQRESENSARHKRKKFHYDNRIAEHQEGVRAVRETRRRKKAERLAVAEDRVRQRWEQDIESRGQVHNVLALRLQTTGESKSASLAQLAGTAKMINTVKHHAMSEYKGAFDDQAAQAMSTIVCIVLIANLPPWKPWPTKSLGFDVEDHPAVAPFMHDRDLYL